MSHHDEILNKEWMNQQPMIKEIYEHSVPMFVSSISNLADAFKLKDKDLRCIDERTPGGIHMAGSGILLDKEVAIERCKTAGVTGIYSHEECGAAVLYARNNDLDTTKGSQYAIEWAKELAEGLGVPYKGHIESNQLNITSGVHVARVIYYDGSGSFDYTGTSDLPPGFIISRRFQSKEDALAEVKVAIGIATGDHGFGSKIDTDNPLVVIAIGSPTDEEFSLQTLEQELRDAGIASDRVTIDAFTAPRV